MVMQLEGNLMKTLHFFSAFIVAIFSVAMVHAQGTSAFVYQGQLRDGGTNANGAYTITCKLYDAVSGGNEIGGTNVSSATLANGIFSVSLDFGGNAFDGNPRWLDITVANGTTTETLSPRVPVSPAPYAIYAGAASSLNSGTWDFHTGDFESISNVFEIFDNGIFVLGMSTNGVLFNGGIDSQKLHTGSISMDDELNINYGGTIFLNGNTESNGVSLSSDGGYGLNIGGNVNIQNILQFNDGTTLSPGGQGSLQTSGDLTTSNIMSYGNIIRFPNQSGATMLVQTNGDFVFDGNLKISAQGILKIPTENPTPVSLWAYGQGGQTLVVDARIQPNSINLPTPGNGFVLIDADANNNVVIHGKLAIPSGDITIGGGITASGNISANSFTTTSDRNAKENFAPVNSQEILDRVAALPISRWNFKTDNTRHIGPMAQDFYSTFGVGADDRHIATVDEDGVALAAIQGLNDKLKEKDAEIQALAKRLAELEKRVNTESQATGDTK